MDKLTLQVEARTDMGKKAQQVRNSGKVPGVIYGRGDTNQSVAVDALVFAKAYQKAGQSGLIELSVGEAKPVNVLIQDVQTNHLGRPLHVDFYQVKMDETIRTEVPLKLVGDAPGAFNLGGSLVQVLEEVEVEALPANLPSAIEVDVSGLEELESSLSVADLKTPDKVTILTDTHELVCRVESPRSEEEMAELDAEMGEEVKPEDADAAETEATDATE
jgi:large subunit ribosomal protein L25